MDPIKGMNQIAQILRQKLAERNASHIKSSSGSDASPSRSAPARAPKATVDDIKRKIGERIGALPDKERRSPRAAQIFVEIVITWEFGEQILQDPQFTDLANEVVNAMVENPVVWEKMQTLLDGLGRTA